MAEAEKADELAELAGRGRFERAFSVSPIPMTLATLSDGCFRDVNDAFLGAMGYRREDLIGRSSAEVGIWVSQDARNALVAEVQAHGVARGMELAFRTASGEERIFLMGAAIIDDPAEPLLLLMGTDLTDRQHAEAALKDSEARYRHFMEDLPLGVLVTQDGIICFVNPALQAMIGYPVEELVGHPFLPFLHIDDQPRVIALHQRRMRGEAVPETYECRLVTHAGEVRNWRMAARTIDWNGPASLGVVTDITELKRAEAELQLAASVFSQAHEGIIITDADARIIAVNDSFTRLTGYSREEAMGQNPRLLRSDRQEPEFYAQMWQALLLRGEWQGELWNRRKDGTLYSEQLNISCVCDADGNVLHYVGLFSDTTAAKQHQQQLEHMAHYDALTGLPNRVLLADRLQLAQAQAERSQDLLAVCYLDLDGFKPINDGCGHETGDRLLVDIAHRLKACVRGGDTVARLGGDEFVLLLGGLSSVEECERTLGRILAAVAAPCHIGSRTFDITASIGVTMFPIDHVDADTLLRDADQAMYAAKHAGRNRYHLFDAEHDRRSRAHREQLSGLREALERGEFRLYYQPKVNMRTGAVVGAEALLRWQHPQRGLLLPGQFLAVAEDTDLIVAIGEWVMREGLRQTLAWQAAGLHLPVSVNIAAHHLQQENFTGALAGLLHEAGDAARGMLELEILESAALADISSTHDVIARCRTLGVTFALDDFGTGYSSLTYFRRLPAETLKIDQSFVRDMLTDPEDLAIVDGVIGLTEAFHRKVIAEGVETAEHGVPLLQLGCDLAQGYGIARPMPAEAIPAWAASWRPDPLWEMGQMLRLAHEDFALLAAQIAHKRWVEQLHIHVDTGVGELPPLKATECSFGRWLRGVGSERHGERLQPLIDLHEALHAQGQALVDSGHSGSAAAPALAELSRQRDDMLAELGMLIATLPDGPAKRR